MGENERIVIIGAGIAGLTAAITLASGNVRSFLVSNQQSQRAASCMAEGGINAAVDPHHEGDSTEKHYLETCRSADGIADEQGIRELTEAAPELVRWLQETGTRFTLTEEDTLEVRAFGGQKYKRTVFAGDSTGKQIMTALIDRARKYEAEGLIQRLSHHSFTGLKKNDAGVTGCFVKDIFSGEMITLECRFIIIASGGYHGLFGNTTGARTDDGEVTARLFAQGVTMSNLEFIQFHPTTIKNGRKRLLITEAARGEGGRLCVIDQGKPFYFMEEKYPELKNLMPRDVTAREIDAQKSQVYLDLRGIDPSLFRNRLRGLQDECLTYLGLDPSEKLIPVEPGIHYFMGGIWVDRDHAASIDGLYAAGECACCYHGANRLGGNSLLGACYGGKKAAESILGKLKAPGDEGKTWSTGTPGDEEKARSARTTGDTRILKDTWKPEDTGKSGYVRKPEDPEKNGDVRKPKDTGKPEQNALPDLSDLETSPEEKDKISEILNKDFGMVRDEQTLLQALEELRDYRSPFALLARAGILCALAREESRGAHYRSDFPQKDHRFQGASIARSRGGEIRIEICSFNQTAER